MDLQSVHVDMREQTIFLKKTGMRIDVGGIGKGYAADQAVEAMEKAGALAGVVALSGDIKTFGRLPEGEDVFRRYPTSTKRGSGAGLDRLGG